MGMYEKKQDAPADFLSAWGADFDGAENSEIILCAASFYTKKFYLNPIFDGLPQRVRDELKIACVLHTEEVGGEIQFVYDDDGELEILTSAKEDDILFDEIGCGLKVAQMRREKKDLFESLQVYFQMMVEGQLL